MEKTKALQNHRHLVPGPGCAAQGRADSCIQRSEDEPVSSIFLLYLSPSRALIHVTHVFSADCRARRNEHSLQKDRSKRSEKETSNTVPTAS